MLRTPGKIKIPRKLKWGLAGCGNYAEESFLPAVQLVKMSKLVSVYSHDINRAKHIAHKAGAPNAFDDFDAFLASDIEVVFLSSMSSDHHRQVLKAAAAGKHIVCTRPLAITSLQAKEMIDACKANNVRLILNHTHRFHPQVLKAKELIDKQILGNIISISASYNVDLPAPNNYRYNKELSGGGVLRDLGSQMIDTLRFFGGEIVEVKSFLDNIIYKSEVEDFASAMLRFERNGYGYFNVSYNVKKAFNRIEILGTKGLVAIENFIGKKNVPSRLIIDLHGEAKKVFRKRANKLSYMVRSVQRTLLRREAPPVTGEEGLRNLLVIEEIEKQCRRK